MNNFRAKLNFDKKTIVFIEKEYTLKTDHKTGLLLHQIQKESGVDTSEKMVALILGKEKSKELFEEMEVAATSCGGSENYTENINVIVFGLMSVLYNKPYETFEEAFKKSQNGETEKK